MSGRNNMPASINFITTQRETNHLVIVFIYFFIPRVYMEQFFFLFFSISLRFEFGGVYGEFFFIKAFYIKEYVIYNLAKVFFFFSTYIITFSFWKDEISLVNSIVKISKKKKKF